MDEATRDLVRRRAGDRCEYGRLPQEASVLTFHVDPETGQQVPLFHPRNDSWRDHFLLRGGHIVGITPPGRATTRLLNMNAPQRVELREQWLTDGHSL